MFNIRYSGLRLIPSKSAGEEMLKYGICIEDCREILEKGYEPRKRGKDTIEKWTDFGDKTYNVVVVKDYDEILKEEAWVIIHVGRFTKKRLGGIKNEML